MKKFEEYTTRERVISSVVWGIIFVILATCYFFFFFADPVQAQDEPIQPLDTHVAQQTLQVTREPVEPSSERTIDTHGYVGDQYIDLTTTATDEGSETRGWIDDEYVRITTEEDE
jgi:hypothetical protein